MFIPHNKRPYELNFREMMGVTYAADHLVAFGTVPEDNRDLLGVYHMTIVERGGVKADIEMTRGEARMILGVFISQDLKI